MAADETMVGQVYPNQPATAVFENDRVVVQRLAMEVGAWVGEHSHAGNQLVVAITGGTTTYREAGEETSVTRAPGEVFWVDAVAAHDHAVQDDVIAILVTLADAPAGMAGAQAYPNVTPDVAFDNDRLVAQRLSIEPGSWAGEHSHAGNQLVVVLKGGTMVYREGGEDTEVTYADGEVFWIDAVEAHDHTAKDAPVDAVLITLK
jgi:quercetin dioxygenase-like cupin family protein